MTLLNTKDACGYLGITKQSYFRELVANGEIGYKVIGHTKYFPQTELDRWQNELHYTNYTKETKHIGLTSPYHKKTEITLDLDVLAKLEKKASRTLLPTKNN